MHCQCRQFVESVKVRYSGHFWNKRVLECGALVVNGSIANEFASCAYTGVDVIAGKGVNVISKVHELEYPDEHFDVVISTEMLEHDMFWRSSVPKMERMVKPGGLLILTCAAPGRNEHGTADKAPQSSGTALIGNPAWSKYYRPLTDSDLRSVLHLDEFVQHEFSTNKGQEGGTREGTDTYFFGLKDGILTQAACI